jgi:trk system potassium uptake protein TrkH
LCIAVIFLVLSVADNFDFETNASAVVSCFNNIGPGFSKVGPISSYAAYSVISKWVLSIGMLMGRLEILPMILLFAPSSWIKFRTFKRAKR